MSHPLRPQAEEGASATLFLLSLFVFLGIAMLAIDVGFVMTSRRGQIADTDSAALAAAQAMIDDRCGNDPTTEATTYVDLNNPSTQVDSVSVTSTTSVPAAPGCEPASGVVEVSTTHQSVLIFAPLFGYDEAPTAVTSGAAYGQITALEGLRPIGLCVNDPHFTLEWQPYLAAERDPAVADWDETDWDAAKTAAATAYEGFYPGLFTPDEWHPSDLDGTPYTGHVHRFVFQSPSVGNSCGQGPMGNFGWLDFDGDGGGDVPEECDEVSSGSELICDLETGFSGLVGIDPPDCDPTDDAVTNCLSEPGGVAAAGSSPGSVLNNLRCPATEPAGPDGSCETLYIVVYGNDPVQAGGASDEQFVIVSVTGLVIRDFRSTGTTDERYIDVEFVDEIAVGSIGPVDPTSTAPLGVELCKVDDVDKCDYGP